MARLQQASSPTIESKNSLVATMSQILSTDYLGSTSFAIQTASGATVIYYQHADGSIHQVEGVGPLSSGARYIDNVLIPSGNARINTPLAAVTWGTEFDQIRFYYVGRDNHIHEICYPGGALGLFDGKGYKAAPNSNLLYAICNFPDHPRVGFQSIDAPASITEAYYTPETNWNSTTLA